MGMKGKRFEEYLQTGKSVKAPIGTIGYSIP